MGLPTQTDSKPSAASSSATSISKASPGTHSSRISIINIKSSNSGAKNGGQPKEPIIQVKVSSPLYNKHRPTSLDDLMGEAGVPVPKPQDQVPVGVTNNINIIINNNRNDAEEKNGVTQVHTRTNFPKPTSSSKRPEGNNNNNNNSDLGNNNRSNSNHINNNKNSRSGSWNNNRNFGNGVPEPHRFGRNHLLSVSNGLRRPTHSGICRRDSHSAERKDLFSPQDNLKTPSILKDILKQQNLNPVVPRLPRTRKRDLYRHPRSKSLCCRIPSQRIPTIPEENDNDLLPIQKVVTHMKTIETLPSYPKIEYLDYPFEENEYGLANDEMNKTATNLNGRDNKSCALYADDEYKHNVFNARENGMQMQRHQGGHAEETKKMGHGGMETVEGEGVTKVNRMLIGLTEDIDDDIKRFIDDEYDEDREEELSDLEFRILEKKLKEEEEEEIERNLKKEEYQITQKKMEDAEVTVIGDSALVGVFDDHNNNINQYSSSLSIASTSSGVSSSSCASSASSSSSSSSSATDKTSKVSFPSLQSPTPPPSASPKCKKPDSPDSSLLVSSASSSSSPSSSTSSSPVSVRSRSSSAPPPASLEGVDPAVEDTPFSPPSPPSSSKPSSSLISPAEVSEKLHQTPSAAAMSPTSSTTSPSCTSNSRSLFSPSSTDGNFKRSYTLPSFVRSFTPPSFKSFQTPRLPILSPLGIVTSHRSPLGEWVPSSSRSTFSSSSTSSSSAASQPSATTHQPQSSGGTLTSSSCSPNPTSASSPSTSSSSSSSFPAQAAPSTTTTTSPSSSAEPAPSSSSPPPPSSKTEYLKEEGEHLRKKKAWMRELFFKMPYEEYHREAISKHKRSNSCPRLRFREQKKVLEKRRENGELEQGKMENRNSIEGVDLPPSKGDPVEATNVAPAAASRESAVTTVSAAPGGSGAARKPAANALEPDGSAKTKPATQAATTITTADVSTPFEVARVARQKDTSAGGGAGAPANAASSSCWRIGGKSEEERSPVGAPESKTKLRVVHMLEKKRVGGKGGQEARGSEVDNFGRHLSRAEEENVGRPSRAEEENCGRPLPESGKIWTTKSSNPTVGDITEGKQDFGGGGVGEDSGGGQRIGAAGEGGGRHREKGGGDVGDSVGRSSPARESREPEVPVSAQTQNEDPQPSSRQPHPRAKPSQPPPAPITPDSVSNAISNIEYAASILHQFPPSPLPRYVTATSSSSSSSTSTTIATNRQPPPPPKRHSVATVTKPASGIPTSSIANTCTPEPPRRQTIPYNVNATIAASCSSSSSSSSSISSGSGHQLPPQWDSSFVLANIGAMDQTNFTGRKSLLKKNFPVDYDSNHLTNHNTSLMSNPPIRNGQDGLKNGVAAPNAKTVRIQTPFLNDDVIHQGLLISPQDDNLINRQLSIDNHSHYIGNIYGNRTSIGSTNDNAMGENINGNLYTNNFSFNKGTRPKTNSRLIEQHPRKIRQSKKTEENGSSQKTNVQGKRVTIVMRKGESHANHDILFQCHNTTGPAVIVSRFPVSASPVPTPSPSPAPSFMSTSSSSSCSSASSRVRSPAIPTAL